MANPVETSLTPAASPTVTSDLYVAPTIKILHKIPLSSERRRVISSMDFCSRHKLLDYASEIEKRMTESTPQVLPTESTTITSLAPVVKHESSTPFQFPCSVHIVTNGAIT